MGSLLISEIESIADDEITQEDFEDLKDNNQLSMKPFGIEITR